MEKGGPNQAAAAAAAAAAELPDDLVVEILARLPARTLCRCKCVSQSWRALIADPAHRARLAQTLKGFFVFSRPHSADAPSSWSFITTTEGGAQLVDTALSFLPSTYGEIEMLDSCNGLLLLRCSSDHDHQPSPRRQQQHDPFYVVCNPTTEEWVALPQPSEIPGQRGGPQGYGFKTTLAALGFDPTVSSHFYVFQLVEQHLLIDDVIRVVEIYSSATGTWITRLSGWDLPVFFGGGHKTYFKGFLYLSINLLYHAIVAVDTNGQTWRFTQVQGPREGISCGFVGHSQGCLLYIVEDQPGNSLSIYGLEDHKNEESTMKHSVSRTDLFGLTKSQLDMEQKQIAFHPDGDLMFFYNQPRDRFMCYDMTRGDLNVICAVGGAECCKHFFLPYIPFYKRSLLAPPN